MATDEEHRHSHNHSERSYKLSSTAVHDGPKHAIHNHHHSSGICCSTADSSSDELWLNKLEGPDGERDSSDVERGPPNYERVVLLIDGLQCGCCEGGITRTVARLTAIREYSVNVVLARLEFELDTNRLSVTEVIDKLGAKTGYSFEEHIVPQGQVLELLVTDPDLLRLASTPFGIIQVDVVARRYGHRTRLGRHFCMYICPSATFATGIGSASQSRRSSAVASRRKHADKLLTPLPDKFSPAVCGDTAEHLVQVQYNALQIGARDVYEYYLKVHGDLKLAPPVSHSSLAMGAKQTQNALFWFIPTLVFTLPVVIMAWAPIDHQSLVYAHTSLALATAVQLIAFKQFVPNALRSLWYARVFEMDFLIALSSGIAYVFSVIAYGFQVKGRPLENTSSFFETSTLLVTLILLGRVINEFARYRAAKSVSFRYKQTFHKKYAPLLKFSQIVTGR
jgi:copper chaperone CopZ